MSARQRATGLTVLVLLVVAAAVAVATGIGSDEISDDVPTMLVGEPAVFRLTGYEGATANSDTRYVVIFKLNRDPVIEIDPDREGPDEERGSFGVAGYALGYYGEADAMQGRKNCFKGTVETLADDDPGRQVGRLDRVPPGGRVEVALKPLTPSTTGKLVPGRLFVRHPRGPDRRSRALLRSWP